VLHRELVRRVHDVEAGVLPRWFGWFGIVVAIALVFDVTYVNILPLVAWVGVASIVLLIRQGETATATAERRYDAANVPVAAHR
jgi:hypothetical protein